MSDDQHKTFVTTIKLGSGYAAVTLWWCDENSMEGGFWEPWSLGIGRYATQQEAAVEAREIAECEGLEYKEGTPA